MYDSIINVCKIKLNGENSFFFLFLSLCNYLYVIFKFTIVHYPWIVGGNKLIRIYIWLNSRIIFHVLQILSFQNVDTVYIVKYTSIVLTPGRQVLINSGVQVSKVKINLSTVTKRGNFMRNSIHCTYLNIYTTFININAERMQYNSTNFQNCLSFLSQ